MTFRFSFTSEIYGMGFFFRRWGNYPRFLPLFFSSDHGVSIGSLKIEEEGVQDTAPFYITWSKRIAEDPKNKKGSKVVGIKHPWLLMAKKYGWKQSSNAAGSVFFPFHSVPGVISLGISDLENLEFVRNLPSIYQPVRICLHPHDMGSSRQEFYEGAGLKVVTAGGSSDPQFLAKLYGVLREAQYTFSEGYGTQIAYAVQLKIPSQIIDRDVKLTRVDRPTYEINSEDAEFQGNLPKITRLFGELPTSLSEEQIDSIQDLLGSSFKFSKIKIVIVCWASLINPGARIIFNRILQRLIMYSNRRAS